ncbi:hypothetical protein JCM9534A_35430 [Catenuloplanes indicus JCM 9534]
MPGRTARLMLLLATVLGLALMHTLGHTGVRTDTHHPASTGTHESAAGTHAQVTVGVTMAAWTASTVCPDDRCGGHGGHGAGVWSVCLAILTGLVVLVMLLWLAAAGYDRQRLMAAGVLRALMPRAPPDRPAGLTLASVAVLRI